MRFAIADTEYFNAVGFDTTNWRKSLDGTKALAHADFVLVVCREDDVDIYNHNSEEFLELINGTEWSTSDEIE